MIITPNSKTDAINEILSAIGSSPVNTIEDSQNVDVINATRILEGISEEVQNKGWDFNTETGVYLSPDVNTAKVPCSWNYIKFYANGLKLVRRSGYFFDIIGRTDKFPEGLTLTLIRKLDFEELPEIFRRYVTVKACRIFQARFLTSTELDNHLGYEEAKCYADVLDYELTTANYNVFQGDTFISVNIGRS